MSRLLKLICPFLVALARAATASTLDPAHYAIELTDLGAGVIPTAINNLGQVAGRDYNSGQAFRWESGALTLLGTLGGAESFANDLNDAGVVVGWSHDGAGKQKSFKWDGAMTNLDSTVAFEGAAEAINNHDEIVGWRTTGNIWGSVRWDRYTADGEYIFGGQSLKPLGINDHSEIVGVALNSNGIAYSGFYWDGFGVPTQTTSGLGQGYLPIAGINNNGITAGAQSGVGSYIKVNIGQIEAANIGPLPEGDFHSQVLGLSNSNYLVGESANRGIIYDYNVRTTFNLNSFQRFTGPAGNILRLTDINDHNAFSGVALVDGGIEHGIVGRFVPLRPGDYDLDGDVDGDDLLAWQRQLGAPAEFPFAGADGDGSGTIDAADLAVWRDHFGPDTLTCAAVPEPSALALLMLGLFSAINASEISVFGIGGLRSTRRKSFHT